MYDIDILVWILKVNINKVEHNQEGHIGYFEVNLCLHGMGFVADCNL